MLEIFSALLGKDSPHFQEHFIDVGPMILLLLLLLFFGSVTALGFNEN